MYPVRINKSWQKKLTKSPAVQRLSHYFLIRWENDFYCVPLIIYKAFSHILSSIKGFGGRLLLPQFDKTGNERRVTWQSDFRPQSGIPSITLWSNLSLRPPYSDVAHGTLPRCLPLIRAEFEMPSPHRWPQHL